MLFLHMGFRRNAFTTKHKMKPRLMFCAAEFPLLLFMRNRFFPCYLIAFIMSRFLYLATQFLLFFQTFSVLERHNGPPKDVYQEDVEKKSFFPSFSVICVSERVKIKTFLLLECEEKKKIFVI